MNGEIIKKSLSLERLVQENSSCTNELKEKLTTIVTFGQDYDCDVLSQMKILILSQDREIVILTAHAIAEFSKCEAKRAIYAIQDIIKPILDILKKEMIAEHTEVFKQCCRCLGNLSFDCDTTRNLIYDNNGIETLANLLKKCIDDNTGSWDEVKLLVCKAFLNYNIGGAEMSQSLVDMGVVDIFCTLLEKELKKADVNDDVIFSTTMAMSVVPDNIPEYQFSEKAICLMLNILNITTNIELCEIILDVLNVQAENDSAKTLLASSGGARVVCARLEELVTHRAAGELSSDAADVETVVKSACDLLIIILNGDVAMNTLYNAGLGEVYLTMVRWLDSADYTLLATGITAIGNFARSDENCIDMMETQIFDKFLDLFETYLKIDIKQQEQPGETHPIDEGTVAKIEYAIVSGLRNMCVPLVNKHAASASGRAARLMLRALPVIQRRHVVYKLLGALRMMIDGHDTVARQLADDGAALAAAAAWGHSAEYAGAAGEAPRLLAWCVKQLRHDKASLNIIRTDGCVSCIVSMLVASHSVMQNEAILALTLLALETIHVSREDQTTLDFVAQLREAEIGKHVSVLTESNCAKMPREVAENLLAFLDVTCTETDLSRDYKENNVHESLQKLVEARKEFNDDLKSCINHVIVLIKMAD